MAKETCSACDTRLPARLSFCPACDRPTQHATDQQLLEYDLKSWRAHVERSVAVGGGRTSAAIRVQHPIVDPAAQPRIKQTLRSVPMPRLRIRLPKASLPSRETGDRVIALDSDNPFAYSACTECARSDWIVRTKHNEDDTWMYWCVRCSRSFKTEVRLRNAVKPFVAAGSVIGLLLTASQLMLR